MEKKIDRKPIYAAGGKVRVCSMANGLWQFQVQIGPGGNKQHDPWRGVWRPTSLELAMGQMTSHEKGDRQ